MFENRPQADFDEMVIFRFAIYIGACLFGGPCCFNLRVRTNRRQRIAKDSAENPNKQETVACSWKSYRQSQTETAAWIVGNHSALPKASAIERSILR